MVAVVAGALAFAGLGTLLFARQATAANDRGPLLDQATSIAKVIDTTESRPATTTVSARARLRLRQDMALVAKTTEPVDCAYFFVVRATGSTLFVPADSACAGSEAQVPSVLSATDVTALGSRDAVGLASSNTAYAFVPLDLPATLTSLPSLSSGVLTLVLVQHGSLPPSTGLYLLVASSISLVIAAIVAFLFARRTTRPIAVAAATTRKMAAGDLDARVPVSAGDHPEVQSLAAAINTMAEGLSRARGQERQFLLSISHDLRTPLTSIRGYAEGLLDGATDDPRRAATVILSESRRLERLIADLLDLARLDSRQFTIAVRRTDLDEVARTSASGVRLTLEEAGLSLDVPQRDEPAGNLIVAADPDRLAQVIASLVDNASRFATSKVLVAASANPAEHGTALLVVEDDGPGIAPEDLPHVFERFYTSERRAGAPRRGSGLGLAIVSELVSAMGGTVRAVSPAAAAGGGTRIEVRLRRWVDAGAASPVAAGRS
jgi:signal transduction histidine kinase